MGGMCDSKGYSQEKKEEIDLQNNKNNYENDYEYENNKVSNAKSNAVIREDVAEIFDMERTSIKKVYDNEIPNGFKFV